MGRRRGEAEGPRKEGGTGKKRRAIIPQLLEISVSINLVSPRPRRRRCFAPRPGRFFPVHRFPRAVYGRYVATSSHAVRVRAYTRDTHVSFEFRPIDDELIARLISRLTSTGRPAGRSDGRMQFLLR